MLKRTVKDIIMIFLTTLILSCNAFWWRATSEATPLVKQIPVGYFRTYTYHQPMTFPSFYNNLYNSGGGGNGGQSNRFSTWTQFPPPPSSASNISPNYKYETPILQSQVTVVTPTPTPTPTTQAPTQPPPPAITQTSHQYQSQVIPSSPNSNNLIVQSFAEPYPQQHTFTGSLRSPYYQNSQNNHPDYHYHPKYQYYYPNMPVNQQQQQQQQKPLLPHVRFVPCMCPVTVAMANNDYPENRSSSVDNDDGMIDLTDNDLSNDNHSKTKDDEADESA